MNFINGTVESTKAGASFVAPGLNIALNSPLAANKQAIAGLRPTDIELDPQGQISGRVLMSEKTGAEVNLHVQTESGLLVATASRSASIKPKEHVTLSIDPQKLHLFDRKTEASLRSS